MKQLLTGAQFSNMAINDPHAKELIDSVS